MNFREDRDKIFGRERLHSIKVNWEYINQTHTVISKGDVQLDDRIQQLFPDFKNIF